MLELRFEPLLLLELIVPPLLKDVGDQTIARIGFVVSGKRPLGLGG
jgi:hypothetical protein